MIIYGISSGAELVPRIGQNKQMQTVTKALMVAKNHLPSLVWI